MFTFFIEGICRFANFSDIKGHVSCRICIVYTYIVTPYRKKNLSPDAYVHNFSHIFRPFLGCRYVNASFEYAIFVLTKNTDDGNFKDLWKYLCKTSKGLKYM